MVTGADHGIGTVIARKLAMCGAGVVLTALSYLADERFDAFFEIKDDVVKQVRRANL